MERCLACEADRSIKRVERVKGEKSQMPVNPPERSTAEKEFWSSGVQGGRADARWGVP